MENPIEPDHYVAPGGNLEGLHIYNIIEAFDLSFALGTAVKLIIKGSNKKVGTIEDLQKARWYLDRAIKHAIMIKKGLK